MEAQPSYTTEADTRVLFRAISHFVSDIHSEFGGRLKSLRLYNRLLSKVTQEDSKSIVDHIACFKRFYDNNPNILERKLDHPTISFTERIYIDIKNILGLANPEQTLFIWKHLLLIHALISPAKKLEVKNALTSIDNEEKDRETKQSSKLLNDMFGKITSSIPQGTNDPIMAMTSLVSSGAMSEIIGMVHQGMASGTLDPKKIIGNLPGLMDQLDIPKEVKEGMSQGLSGNGGGEGMNQMLNQAMGFMNTLLPGMMGGMGAPQNLQPSALPSLPAITEEDPSCNFDENGCLHGEERKGM